MVQVLPYLQTPLEQLLPHINQLAGGIGKGLGAYQRNKRDQSILASIRDDIEKGVSSGDASGIGGSLYSQFIQLSEGAQKTALPFLESHLRAGEATHKENLKRETAAAAEGLKRETADLELGEKAQAAYDITKSLRRDLSYTGTTLIPGTSSFDSGPLGMNRKGLKIRNSFDARVASAASFLRDLETKGQLPQGLFKRVIEPRLPNSELSEAENEGRLDGLEELIEAYGGKTFKKSREAERASTKRSEPTANESEEPPPGTVWMISPNHERVPIPIDQVQAALSSGGKLTQ